MLTFAVHGGGGEAVRHGATPQVYMNIRCECFVTAGRSGAQNGSPKPNLHISGSLWVQALSFQTFLLDVTSERTLTGSSALKVQLKTLWTAAW